MRSLLASAVVLFVILTCSGCGGNSVHFNKSAVLFPVHADSQVVKIQVLPGSQGLAMQVGNRAELTYFNLSGVKTGSFLPDPAPDEVHAFYVWGPDSVILVSHNQLLGYGPHGTAHPISLAGVFGDVVMDDRHPIFSLTDRIYFLANNDRLAMVDLTMVYRYNFHKHTTDGLVAYPKRFSRPVGNPEIPVWTTDGSRLICALPGQPQLLIYDLQNRTEQIVSLKVDSETAGLYYRAGSHEYFRLTRPDANNVFKLQLLKPDLSLAKEIVVSAEDYDPAQAFVAAGDIYLRQQLGAAGEVAFDRIIF